MRIERDFYLDKLVAHKHNGMVKVVTGVRRCGKSYLLFELFMRHLLDSGVPRKRIIDIQLDDRKNKALRDPDACDAFVRGRVGTGQHYVMIDEVQLMPEFEDVLLGFLHIPNLDVYVTGSNSRFLSSDIITEFRGRGDQVRVHPLSFAEYHAAMGRSWDDDWGDYLVFGGMPYAASLPDAREKTSYLQGLFDEVYLRDIMERNELRSAEGLEDIVDVIASAIGSLSNPGKLERTFRSAGGAAVSAPTIKRYLGYLEDAFLISEAKRYDVKGRRHIGGALKYYFEDVGLRNARLNFRQQEPTHIMENIIYNELVARGYAVDVGVVELRQGDARRQVEIDFVANAGDRRYYVQSAFALPDDQTRAREVRPLANVNDSFRKIIVVGGSQRPWHDDNGIVTMGIRQFLLDPNSLDWRVQDEG